MGHHRALRRDDLLHGPDGDSRLHEVGRRVPGKHDLSSLRLLGTVGEPINPKAWLWYREVIGGGECPIVDTWWQTETGHILITTLPGRAGRSRARPRSRCPAIDAAVLDEDGEDAGTEQGLLALRQPWPGMLRTLYKEDDRFVETYFSKFGKDDVLRRRRRAEGRGRLLLGHRARRRRGQRLRPPPVDRRGRVGDRLPSKVAEAAVIGQADEDTGQAICAFVTLEGDLEGSDELVEEIREHVAERIGKLARPKRIIWTDDLPKTRSGKIMRRLLRDIAEGRELGDVTTLRDPDVVKQLDEIVNGRAKEGKEE